MATPGPTAAAAGERLAALVRRGKELEAEGLPFPTAQLQEASEALIAHGQTEQALGIVKRGESLYSVAARDWTWIKQSLARADELAALATSIGLDVGHLESRVGNPRDQLLHTPLSAASLSRAAASASLAVAVLSDAIPKHVIQEAQKLGESIRTARNRGEDVTAAVGRFSELLQSIQDQHPVAMARGLVEARRAVARIPRAPSMAALPSDEEEEILLEARNLARRLSRIKSKARNAQSAARLMTQVRAALSEDRRFGTPEEEIEALWTEVDRITRERQRAATEDPAPLDHPEPPIAPAEADSDVDPEAEELAAELTSSRARAARRGRP
jgi:hypothetical protein